MPRHRDLREDRAVTRTGVIAAGLAFAIAMPLSADENTTKAEIDHMLAEVAESGCVFIRNGDEHDADAARDHLAMKRRRGRRHFDTADEFIEKIASRSSFSGKPYHIRCDGDQKTAKLWFEDALSAYRAEQNRIHGS